VTLPCKLSLTSVIFEELANVKPAAAAGEGRQRVFVEGEAGQVSSNKVCSGKHVVVIIDGYDHVTSLLVSVEDADISTLDATPWQVRVKLRVLHAHQEQRRKKSAKSGGRECSAPWTCKLSGPQHP
jgi:hypothetical protein